MKYRKLQVFDPPMCCLSGVCGPDVDPELARFARDLDWLREQGVEIERYNLSSRPAAVAQHECVREALSKQGTQCLPLVLADGFIESEGGYPSRSELMEFAGIGDLAKDAEPVDAAAESAYASENAAMVCGPGCDCEVASVSKRIKTAVSLVALMAVVGILIYKGASAGQTAAGSTAAGASAVFAVAQAAPAAEPLAAEQPPDGLRVESAVGGAGPLVRPETAAAPQTQPATRASKPAKPASKMGANLGSLNDLNKVAMGQDAVFIFIPGPKDESPGEGTSSAVQAARKSIEAKNISLGLYTLSTGSPDYSAISKQAQTPAIVVATKGRGMTVVSGDVTETKLLQAYVASSSASCGPSGCGPSGCG